MSEEHPRLEDFRLVRRTDAERADYTMQKLIELQAQLAEARAAIRAWMDARGPNPTIWTDEELAARPESDPLRRYMAAVKLAQKALGEG